MTAVEILIYGTIQSVSLLLIAFGFSLVYGISRLPNFAHGALYVFTGYVAWALLNERTPARLGVLAAVGAVTFVVLGFQSGPAASPPLVAFGVAGSLDVASPQPAARANEAVHETTELDARRGEVTEIL